MSWNDSWVLDDRLRIPGLAEGILHRDRVTGLLDRAAGHRVTLVTGPAGAGKTVACAAWAGWASQRQRVAWLTVDETDREPGRLWSDLAAAFGDRQPTGTARLVPRTRASGEDLPEAVIAGLSRNGGPVVLLLDDVHVLAGSDAAAVLDQLIQHAPPSLRLVLAGRFAPGVQLAKLRVGGGLTTLGEPDLACAPDEAEAYLDTLGLTASPARRAELLGYTGGWMAGLRLIALAGDAAGEYLRDEILGRQPAEVAEIMLRASAAEELTGALAGRLTGRSSAVRVLDQLSRENAFVYRIGDERYRFHPFVRDMLAAELRRRSPELARELLGEMAAWHAGGGDSATAATFAANAGDWGLAARMLADGGMTGLLPERAAELVTALNRVPGAARRGDPAIPAALAAGWMCLDDRAAAVASLDEADRAALALPATTTAQSATRLWLTALRVMAGEDEGVARVGRLLAESQSAVTSTPAEQRALGVLWLVLGSSALAGDDIPGARTALGRAERLFTMAGPPAMRARAAGWRALAEALGGDLTGADRIIAGGQPVRCLARLAAAQCALDRDELAVAARLLEEARSASFSLLPGEPDPYLVSDLIGVRLRLAGGDLPGARRRLDRIPDLAGRSALGTDITLRSGETPLRGQHDDPVLNGRILLACGDAPAALALAGEFLDAPPQQQTPRGRIGAQLLAAVAHRRLGAPQAAAGCLEQALTLAEPHRSLRVFLDGGTTVRSAISLLIRPESRAASFAALVLQRFSYRTLGVPGPPGTAVPLTESELAVLRFLPSHLTNQEIADALCLSVNTVKTHLRTAYRKLGVGSRRAAVATGQRAGLL